jgi:hypothetical protein
MVGHPTLLLLRLAVSMIVQLAWIDQSVLRVAV